MYGTTESDRGDDLETEPDEFRRFYLDHVEVVHRYVANRRQNCSDVADIVAEVFAVAWRRLGSGDLPADPAGRGFLFATARRVLADHRRADKRRAGLLARAGSDRSSRQLAATEVGTPTEETELSERLETALSRLRAKDRELVRLLAWDQIPRDEAADLLGCSVNAINIRLHRALKRLKRELESISTSRSATESTKGSPWNSKT